MNCRVIENARTSRVSKRDFYDFQREIMIGLLVGLVDFDFDFDFDFFFFLLSKKKSVSSDTLKFFMGGLWVKCAANVRCETQKYL